MNILKKANEIVNERSEEKERNYGPFSESMERTAEIFNAITGKNMTPEETYLVLVALKLARLQHSYQEDSVLDTVAYLGAYNNYMQEKNVNVETKTNQLYTDTSGGFA